LILAINFAPVPNKGVLTLALAGVAVAAIIGFVVRQRRATTPSMTSTSPGVASFWVAALGGIISSSGR